MQGSAQWCVRGFGVSLRLGGRYLSVSVHAALCLLLPTHAHKLLLGLLCGAEHCIGLT